MTVPPPHFDDDANDPQPGGLLGELERRQDDVLSQLDDLDEKLNQVLKGLESGQESSPNPDAAFDASTFDAKKLLDPEALLEEEASVRPADELSGDDSVETDLDADFDNADFENEDFGSAEDWA
ncbi:MAG: hypothetical protein AAFV88_21015 [Planctomycetota bacterium]